MTLVGRQPSNIAEGRQPVERVPGPGIDCRGFLWVMKDPSTLLVSYRKEGKSHLARIDLKSREVVQTSEPPSFGPDVR